MVVIVLLLASHIFGLPSISHAETAEEFEAKLKFQSGEINIGNGIAKLNLSKDFRYIDPQMAELLLVKAWGNPPQSGTESLGMIFPNDETPAVASWGAVISYEEDGYVDDEGAEKINYDRMANEIKEAMVKANPERIKQGYAPLTFIGWAEHPHYDKKNHKLYWAKEIKFGDSKENTLNYNIRILGRKGVLVLNAVAVKSQLQEVSQKAELLLPQIDFNPGLASAGFDVNDWNSNRTCFQITKTYTQQEAIAYQGVWSDHEYAQSYFEAIAPCATALNLWYDDLRKTHGK